MRRGAEDHIDDDDAAAAATAAVESQGPREAKRRRKPRGSGRRGIPSNEPAAPPATSGGGHAAANSQCLPGPRAACARTLHSLEAAKRRLPSDGGDTWELKWHNAKFAEGGVRSWEDQQQPQTAAMLKFCRRDYSKDARWLDLGRRHFLGRCLAVRKAAISGGGAGGGEGLIARRRRLWINEDASGSLQAHPPPVMVRGAPGIINACDSQHSGFAVPASWEKRSEYVDPVAKEASHRNLESVDIKLNGRIDLDNLLRRLRSAVNVGIHGEEVNPGSKAAQKGVREGDVISSINGQSTRAVSNSDAHALLRNAGHTLRLGLNEECSGSPKRRNIRNAQQQQQQQQHQQTQPTRENHATNDSVKRGGSSSSSSTSSASTGITVKSADGSPSHSAAEAGCGGEVPRRGGRDPRAAGAALRAENAAGAAAFQGLCLAAAAISHPATRLNIEQRRRRRRQAGAVTMRAEQPEDAPAPLSDAPRLVCHCFWAGRIRQRRADSQRSPRHRLTLAAEVYCTQYTPGTELDTCVGGGGGRGGAISAASVLVGVARECRWAAQWWAGAEGVGGPAQPSFRCVWEVSRSRTPTHAGTLLQVRGSSLLVT
ncbi:microtubule-associated serine/threonine-protein kinase 3-like [Schistocerca gregaria]|uniref:microtubule-associated serine/threonine-protein kinase 3-like n=1 Tax=Schistocerca gregaria TaxID=7010 RepID=UPI00211DF8B3|nr:microtubule-associated serine/threonine-protein kinase 3-like [Schistocerca gregaria]